jgi:hypothetical protein
MPALLLFISVMTIIKRLLAEVGNREQGTEADKTEHLQEV